MALSLGSPRVAVNDLPALWSPDFPPADDPRPPAILPPPPAKIRLPRGGAICNSPDSPSTGPAPAGREMQATLVTMKAIIYDEPGDESVLRIAEVAPPALESGELRIRVAATAVNRADLLQRQGFYPPPPGASPILGLECSGEVTEVGDQVEGWSPGDRAMALLAGGGYAEQVVVHAGSALRVPEVLSLEHAAALPEVFLTVFLNVFQLGAQPAGGAALVHGGGSGIGRI